MDLGSRSAVDSFVDALLNDGVPDESIQPSEHNQMIKNILDTLTGLDKSLRYQNESTGYDLIMSQGDSTVYQDSGFGVYVHADTLSASRVQTLQDKDGVIALLSDIAAGSVNWANTDLTLTADRTHDFDDFGIDQINVDHVNWANSGGNTWNMDMTYGGSGMNANFSGVTGAVGYVMAYYGYTMNGGGVGGTFDNSMDGLTATYRVTPGGGTIAGLFLSDNKFRTRGYATFESKESTSDAKLSADQSYYLYATVGILHGRYRATGGGISDILWDYTKVQPGTNGQFLRTSSGASTWANISTSDITGYVAPTVFGSGTTNYTARWTSSSNLSTGVIQDNGTNAGVGTISSFANFTVYGQNDYNIYVSQNKNNGDAVAIHAEATHSNTGTNIGIESTAGSLTSPRTVSVHGLNIGNGSTYFTPTALLSANDNVGGMFQALRTNAGVSYAVYANANQIAFNAAQTAIGGRFIAGNGGANYAIWAQDGTEASGKFLKSVTSDGKANWSSITAGDIGSGAALTKTDDTNVTLSFGGSPTTALLAATSLTLGWTGTLADARIASASNWNSKQAGSASLTSLAALTYASTSFVKMTGANTFTLDTNTYLTGNQTITLSGDVTGSGTTTITTAISDATVTGKLLTGYVSGAGTVASTDSILQAIQKLNGNIGALTTGVSSVFGRTGAVVAASGDYTISQINGLGTGVATFLGTPTSANLAAAVTGETGSGALVFGTSPTITGGNITAINNFSVLQNGTSGFNMNIIEIGNVDFTTNRNLQFDLRDGTRSVILYGNTVFGGSTFTTAGSFDLTLTATATTNATIPSGTNTLYSTKTGSISSAQMLASMSDETGTGALVFATSPTLVTPALGTPTSGTLTNCTGLPISGLVASTSTAIGVGSIELGHATDTTITRVSAGRIAVEGINVPTISSTDTLTNKTLDNTNIFTIRDDRFTLQDNGDTTKQAVFELSSITTATTRTFTLPNASDTLVGKATTDTFTNKTLTSSTNVLGGVTMTLGSDATGDIYYRTGGVLTRLAIGSTGQVLTVASGLPSWAAASGGADTQNFQLSRTVGLTIGTTYYMGLLQGSTTGATDIFPIKVENSFTSCKITGHWSSGGFFGSVNMQLQESADGSTGGTWTNKGSSTVVNHAVDGAGTSWTVSSLTTSGKFYRMQITVNSVGSSAGDMVCAQLTFS